MTASNASVMTNTNEQTKRNAESLYTPLSISTNKTNATNHAGQNECGG